MTVIEVSCGRPLRPCQEKADDGRCGGLNGYHAEGCPHRSPTAPELWRFTVTADGTKGVRVG